MSKTLHPEVIRYLSEQASKGGRVKSHKKAKAVAENLKKARAKRWA